MMLSALFAKPWQLAICRRSAIADCRCSGPARSLPSVMTCVIVEARTKYGTNDGVRSRVYRSEYDLRRMDIVLAAWVHKSRGDTPDPVMLSLTNGRNSRRMAV